LLCRETDFNKTINFIQTSIPIMDLRDRSNQLRAQVEAEMGRLSVVRQGLAATTGIPAQMGPGQMGVPPIPGQIPRFAHPQVNTVRQQVPPAHRLAP
jgi:hypothetical protein